MGRGSVNWQPITLLRHRQQKQSLPRLKAQPSWSMLSSRWWGKRLQEPEETKNFPLISSIHNGDGVCSETGFRQRLHIFSPCFGEWRRHQPKLPALWSHCLDMLTSLPHSVSPASGSTWGRITDCGVHMWKCRKKNNLIILYKVLFF